MGGKKEEIKETPSQVALADYANNLMADYKRRWLPVQQNLISQIETMGKPGSTERSMAEGRSNVDTAIQFGQASGALEKSLSNSGANVGSSRGKLAIEGLGEDQAKSRGLGAMVSDQQIDDAYMKGLSALAQQGKGERASVSNAMASMAKQSATQAQSDAKLAAFDATLEGDGQIAHRARAEL